MSEYDALLAELDEIRAAARALTKPSGERPGDSEDASKGGDAAPEITVAMPAYNAAPFIAEAVASVLRQTGVRLELVVVDDGSTDATAEVVASLRDPRIVLIRSDRRRGIAHGHNRALEAARSPFIAHVDADDLILGGALRAMLDAFHAEPGAGQAYCNHYLLYRDARIREDDFRRQRAFLEAQRRDHPDYRRSLLRHGMVTNTLRTYRRDVLELEGPFDEALEFAVDYQMALRIADRHPMILVPRFLYAQRVHGANTQQTMRLRALRSWRQRARICERLVRARGGLLGYGPLGARLLVLAGLPDALGIGGLKGRMRRPGGG